MDISAIRFILQRELQDSTIDNETVIIWCNNANSDFGINLNIPDSSSIYLTTTDIAYDLPDDIKIINRLSLQSDIDQGIDRAFTGSYRIYNGQIIFPGTFSQEDTLILDYYKHLTYFTLITDAIDIEDRFHTIYTAYAKMQYYGLPSTAERLTAQQANRKQQDSQMMYQSMKNAVISQYSLKNEPTVINERW